MTKIKKLRSGHSMSRKELTMKNMILAFRYLNSERYEALYGIQQGLAFIHFYKIERRRKLCGCQMD